MKTTFDAKLAVEQASVTYLQAALEETLASPKIQNKLEINLRKSNYLLRVAYLAEQRDDKKVTQDLIKQILQITEKVMTECQEPKK